MRPKKRPIFYLMSFSLPRETNEGLCCIHDRDFSTPDGLNF